MNDELRAALDKLDAALAEARAAMEPEPATEPEPPCVAPVTVHDGEGGEWLEITAIDAFQRPEDDNVRSKIWGKEVKLGRITMCTDNTTPGQLLALCELAGWPKPEVRCEFHHCDGAVCEMDPARVTSVRAFRTAATRVWMGDDDWLVVREPVPVVQRMIDACKESE